MIGIGKGEIYPFSMAKPPLSGKEALCAGASPQNFRFAGMFLQVSGRN